MKSVRTIAFSYLILFNLDLISSLCVFVLGCAIYTGPETKMALNSKAKATKFSRVERYGHFDDLAK